ncbi:unnamed protein product [Prorocentrum cordatum]|uniref:Endonuclease/exonuclease/phosphatase domain-containing protein n=1 Tax=Prorocentrum cordatum TaxID=2364126 RepID=A0ABN9R8J1_9DINO|nr:unnamed protein product [Polarella glacialis]
MALSVLLEQWGEAADLPSVAGRLRRVPADALTLSRDLWMRLIREGARLLETRYRDISFPPLAPARADELRLALVKSLQLAHGCLRLRVGMDNPGPTGCMDRHGRRALWRRLLEHPTSVQRAMNQLGIPIAGLPGARLPESFTLPASSGLGIYAVGGISCASVAVVWSLEFQAHFDFVMGVGSARRVWVQLRLAEGLLFLLYFYLPPDPRSGDDGAWGSEVDSIRREVNSLRAQHSDAVFVTMGDANVQPVSLCGGRDISSGRDVRWAELLVETGLVVCNPSLLDSIPRDVLLPRQRRVVKFRPGDTHHGAWQSRAIDLVLASPGLSASVVVHNSLDCSPCRWPDCVDFCLGDHFLLEADLGCICPQPMGPAALRMPPAWLDGEGWRAGITAVSTPLARLGELAKHFASCWGSASSSRPSAFVSQWVGDCFAVLLGVLEGLARDGWVLPRCEARAAHNRLAAVGPLAAVPTGTLAGGLAHCLRRLELPKPRPPACLVVDSVVLSRAESHEAWRRQLVQQSVPSQPCPPDATAQVSDYCRRLLRDARASIGRGWADAPIVQQEVFRVVDNWDSSSATTPDLLPRVVFQLHLQVWDDTAWALQLLMGPGVLALRPRLRRARVLGTAYKRGPWIASSSFRLLCIVCQHGLLQEGLLFERLRVPLWRSLLDGQSGHVRDCGDAHLVLHEVVASRSATGLPTWLVHGDFVHAFPRTWRSLLLCLLHDAGGVQAGSLALLGSILEWDQVVVTLSGLSTVDVHEGMPEGGVLGPLGFNFFPDSLMRPLHSAGCGAATSTWVPVPWQQHVWLGCGTPRTHLVDMLVPLLECPSSLPSVDMLRAARAGAPLVLPRLGHPLGVPLSFAPKHKWLGLLWRPDLDFEPMLQSRLALAGAACTSVVGLIALGQLPLSVALEAFHAKVDSTLCFSRWLWCIAPGALHALDEAYERWAKAFLGGASWRNSGAAALEMGLSLGGGAQAVLDPCRRRARPHLLPENDFYRCASLRAAGGAQCWAVRSSDLLRVYGVPDWPQWAVPGAQLKDYTAHCKSVLAARCRAEWASAAVRHVDPRAALVAALGWPLPPAPSQEVLSSLLRLMPGQPGYCELVLLVSALESVLARSWRGSDS